MGKNIEEYLPRIDLRVLKLLEMQWSWVLITWVSGVDEYWRWKVPTQPYQQYPVQVD